MMAPEPQSQERIGLNGLASPMTQNDYYSVLVQVIEQASKDPAQLRKLVYAMAWHNLSPEAVLARPLPDGTAQACTILELQRSLELKQAIEQVESDAARQLSTVLERKRALELERASERVEAETAQPPQDLASPPSQSSAPSRLHLTENLNPCPGNWDSTCHNLQSADEPAGSWLEHQGPTPKRLSNDNALIIRPEQQPVWLQRTELMPPDRLPPWLDHPIHVSVHMVDQAPIQGSRGIKTGFLSFLQLVSAAVIGVAVYAGISGWVYLGRPAPSRPTHQTAPPSTAVAAATAATETAIIGEAHSSLPQPAPQPMLPFPLPKTYGVYVGSKSQLTELQPLPIKVPDPRIRLSAEIKEPSRAIVGDGKLAFVVFRRDLVNSAPQTASVRVVARVARQMRVVDGKAMVSPIEGAWRIRSKAYDFKVSPLEGHREMIVIQPDAAFVFPAGRYALVLNGNGYDFTVPGPVTSPEQCLEQAEMLNGTVLSECPDTKSY